MHDLDGESPLFSVILPLTASSTPLINVTVWILLQNFLGY